MVDHGCCFHCELATRPSLVHCHHKALDLLAAHRAVALVQVLLHDGAQAALAQAAVAAGGKDGGLGAGDAHGAGLLLGHICREWRAGRGGGGAALAARVLAAVQAKRQGSTDGQQKTPHAATS